MATNPLFIKISQNFCYIWNIKNGQRSMMEEKLGIATGEKDIDDWQRIILNSK